MNCILIRYGEIGIKSKRTRRWWEKTCIHNIAAALRETDVSFSSIKNLQGRIVVFTHREQALPVLKDIFGITSLSGATQIPKSMDEIKSHALQLYTRLKSKTQTFRISTQRVDKRFPITSQQVNAQVGAYILEHEEGMVDLTAPDITIGIEILQDAAYLFTDRIYGPGGIPVGVQGKALVNLTDMRSVVAAWMILKRGCELVTCGNKPLARYLYPYSFGHPIPHSDSPHHPQCLAYVTSTLDFKKRNIPTFYPLLGLDEKTIEEIISKIIEKRKKTPLI
jgi:thiamine biosynthesis protein ThiI